MRDGTAYIGGQQRNNTVHRRREPLNHHFIIEENSGDFRGIEQVFHIVDGLAQLLGFAEALGVQGHQFLVQALQLLVGVFELFQITFHLINSGLEAVLGVLQLFSHGLYLGIGAGARLGSA